MLTKPAKPGPLDTNFIAYQFTALTSPTSTLTATDRSLTPVQRVFSPPNSRIAASHFSTLKPERKCAVSELQKPLHRQEPLSEEALHRRKTQPTLKHPKKPKSIAHFPEHHNQSKTHYPSKFSGTLFNIKDNGVAQHNKNNNDLLPSFIHHVPHKPTKLSLTELLIPGKKPLSARASTLPSSRGANMKNNASNSNLPKEKKTPNLLKLKINAIESSTPIIFSERESSRFHTEGEGPLRRKNTHSPARYIEIHRPIYQQYSAENLHAYERTGGVFHFESQQLPKSEQQEEVGVIESYRQKLNEQFLSKFGHCRELEPDLEAEFHECEDRYFNDPIKATLEMIPSLERLDSIGKSSSRHARFSTSGLGGSGELKTRKTLNSITKLDSVKRPENKRPAVAGLPSHAILIKSLTNISPGGGRTRKKMPCKTWSNSQSRKKNASEKEIIEEDQVIAALMSHELNVVALPTSILANQRLSQMPVNINPRWFKKPAPTYKRLRKRLLKVLQELKLLKLNPKLLMDTKIFSKFPYEKPKSRELIQACKGGNSDIVADLLHENRFLVYDFDQYHLTALHWAIRRGFFSIARRLIDNGADVNAKDLIGRTPLYFAIQGNRVDLVKLLLGSQCDPWSSEEVNYTEMAKKKRKIKYYLSRSRQIHIIMKMTPPRLRDSVWEGQTLDWMLNLHNRNDAEVEEYDVDVDEGAQTS